MAKKKTVVEPVIEQAVVSEPVKQTFPADDPKFPPIAVRWSILSEVPEADMITWAKNLGLLAEGRAQAAMSVLLYEYGKERVDAFFKV